MLEEQIDERLNFFHRIVVLVLLNSEPCSADEIGSYPACQELASLRFNISKKTENKALLKIG
jgi:hypothetical protein